MRLTAVVAAMCRCHGFQCTALAIASARILGIRHVNVQDWEFSAIQDSRVGWKVLYKNI